MDLSQILDVFLHVDQHLLALSVQYGVWIYAILFVVVFCETGLGVTPFLPGDSLLFATGALCAVGDGRGGLSLAITVPLLITAAVLGDALNYRIGHAVGPGFLQRWLDRRTKPTGLARFIKREHLERTQQFYEKYGGKTIILARFVPIVRTFAPFVAGIGKMKYRQFFVFNVVGAIAWVLACVLAGFFLGEIPFVKQHFEIVVLAIVVVSVLPIAYEMGRGWLAKRRAAASPSA
ncbi:Protein DedA [Gammaproteobacteria bacterium]|nr:Protein DedA [Gammaproteobacteria bacterium]